MVVYLLAAAGGALMGWLCVPLTPATFIAAMCILYAGVLIGIGRRS